MKRILLIGSPGSGKTTILTDLKKRGHICFQEISREIIKEAQQKGIEQLFLSNPSEFNQKVLSGRITQFKNCDNFKEKFGFIDRGLPDIIAYNDYLNITSKPAEIAAAKKFTYDFVFLFPAWKKIFKNDTERYESFEQALIIEQKLKETYAKYGYKIYEVPLGEIYERTNYILNIIEYS